MRKIAIIAAALGLASVAAAQQYSFSVPRLELEATIRPDASVELSYLIEFANNGGAHDIDVVDVALPHARYDLSAMSADIDGHQVRSIQHSSYIPVGVEVNLGNHYIAGGRRGILRFKTAMPDLVFNDTTDDRLASFRITPTWFDGDLLTGVSQIKIAVHLPPGVTPESVLHQGTNFTSKALYQGHTVAVWDLGRQRLDRAHLVGLSFPRSVMQRVVKISRLELLGLWWSAPERIPLRLGFGLALLVLVSVFFFRFSSGTGWSLWAMAVAGLGLLFWLSPMALLISALPLLLLAGLLEWWLRRRRRTYLPPLATIEGGGIKRGLTAPEAAVLLELPLSKVLTLVIFGLLKKGVLIQTNADPLGVRVSFEFDNRDQAARRKAAAEKGIVLHRYEHAFINELVAAEGRSFVRDIDFAVALRGLVDRVVDRMAGFDVEETRAYYRTIIARAWQEAEGLGEVERRDSAVDSHLEWLLLDRDSQDRFERWHDGGYHYRPAWTRTEPSSAGLPVPPGARPAGSLPAGMPAPSLGDVGASFAGWTENLASSFASALMPGKTDVKIGTASAGVIDLSGADQATGSFFKALAEASASSGSSGGHSSGGHSCACACAGCACACACAGGGR
ncbi:MAG: hypothetical protein JXR83_15950 [Deltaproteobacteria bacterium]|nr:hypothetical protein [Deltaproteobacteria bacterium]